MKKPHSKSLQSLSSHLDTQLTQQHQTLPHLQQPQRHLNTALRGIPLALALILSHSPQAEAITIAGGIITVTTPDPAINNDGSCSLIEAIVNANDDAQTYPDCGAGSGDDTIILSGNTYSIATKNNSDYDNNGLPQITSVITIEGNGATIERADNATDVFRLFLIGGDGDLTLTQTTVSGGDPGTQYGAGGGVFIQNGGTATLIDSTVSGNSSSGHGGGIYNSGTLTLTRTTLTGNSSYYSGGGLSNYYGTATITDSTISDNSVILDGAGLHNSGTLSLIRTTIRDNKGTNGGGLHNTGNATLTNSTISGNRGSIIGGGINNSSGSANLTLIHSTVTGNETNPNNPYAFHFGGGGLFNQGTASLSNSVISGNASFGTKEIKNTTSGFGSSTILGTINTDGYNVFGHSGLTNAQAFDGFTLGATDIDATSDGGNSAALTNILNTTLINNGGFTQTHALPTNSPAVDAVPNGSCSQTEDQRGAPRPINVGSANAECDSGAFELNICETPYSLPNNQWRQISLPCNPGNNNTVNAVFGDDGLGKNY